MSVSARVVDAQMPDSHYTSKEMAAAMLEYQSEYESDSDSESDDYEMDEAEEAEKGGSCTEMTAAAAALDKKRTAYAKLVRRIELII